MSVSQVKKRFSEMETFLGRDKEALRRLKLLKDDVNVLRTSLASAVEAKELAEVIKDAARERADKAESEAESLRIENQRLRGRIETLESTLAAVDIIGDADGSDDDARDTPGTPPTEIEMKGVVKQIRKSMKNCPRAMNRTKHLEDVAPVFERDMLAAGWSRHSLWLLGASVAVIACFDGAVVVKSNVRFRDIKVDDADESGMVRNVVQWFGTHNIDWTGTSETAGFARLVNMKHYVGGTLNDETCGVRQVGGDRDLR